MRKNASSLSKSADDVKLRRLADTPDQCSGHARDMKREMNLINTGNTKSCTWGGAKQLEWCPEFGQDRVNFHQKPGSDTARQADPNWPDRTRYSIPCAAMLGSRWGAGRGEGVMALECVGHQAVRVALCISLFVLYILLISISVVTLPFVCCSVKLPLS